jgi:hypothetical protein
MRYRVMLTGLFVAMLAGPAGAATEMGTMTCRDGIVSLGDTQPEVLHKCGEPVFRNQWEEAGVDRFLRVATVAEWTYNFGPNEFMYLVRFVNGRVTRIQSRDRGY